MRLTFNKSMSAKKNKEESFTKAFVIYASAYPEWQQNVIERFAREIDGFLIEIVTFAKVLFVLSSQVDETTGKLNDKWKNVLKEKVTGPLQSKSLQFAAFVVKDFEVIGKESLEPTLPFNELQLLQDNQHFIAKELKLKDIQVIYPIHAFKLNIYSISSSPSRKLKQRRTRLSDRRCSTACPERLKSSLHDDKIFKMIVFLCSVLCGVLHPLIIDNLSNKEYN